MAKKVEVNTNDQRIQIHRMNWQYIKMKIIGETPYISNKFPQHKLDEMLLKQTSGKPVGKSKKAREPRDIEKDWKGTLRECPGGYGIPASAFHNAMIRAVSTIDGLAMTDAKMLFRVDGDLLLITGAKPEKHEAFVKNSDGSTDVRYRGQFKNWKTEVIVKYNADMITAEAIVNLVYRAGQVVGVGDLRPMPKKGAPGSMGTFRPEAA